MLERLFGGSKKKEEKGEPGPLVPGFVENSEMQDIVSRYTDALRKAFGHTHDGQLERAQEFRREADEIEAQHGDQMRTYLQPYIDLDDEKAKGSAVGAENDRRQAANTLKAKDREQSS